MSSAKLKEAKECISRAEKSLKTSLFKWKPDFDQAADEFQKAATCYKTLKKFKECVEFNIKSAECYKQNKQYFSAAKCLEQAALVSGKELQNYDQAVNLIEKSCLLCRENGVSDTAALTYDRGAKMMEAKFPQKAAEFYLSAAEISTLENRFIQAADYSAKAAVIFVKLKNFENASTTIQKQLEFLGDLKNKNNAGRVIAYLILIYLGKEDFVAAQKAYKDYQNYLDFEEVSILGQLLNGLDSMDSSKIVSALNHPFFKSLDTEYTKIAANLSSKHNSIISSTNSNNPIKISNNQEAVNDEAGVLL